MADQRAYKTAGMLELTKGEAKVDCSAVQLARMKVDRLGGQKAVLRVVHSADWMA